MKRKRISYSRGRGSPASPASSTTSSTTLSTSLDSYCRGHMRRGDVEEETEATGRGGTRYRLPSRRRYRTAKEIKDVEAPDAFDVDEVNACPVARFNRTPRVDDEVRKRPCKGRNLLSIYHSKSEKATWDEKNTSSDGRLSKISDAGDFYPPLHLLNLPSSIFKRVIEFLWPETQNIEQTCRRFQKNVQIFWSKMKTLDLTSLVRPSMATRRMLLKRFGQLKSMTLSLKWFEKRLRKGRALVNMRTGHVSGWEMNKTSASNCEDALSMLQALLTRNQQTLQILRLTGNSKLSRQTSEAVLQVLANVPMPKIAFLEIGICASLFTTRFVGNFKNIHRLVVPFTPMLLPHLSIFKKIRNLKICLGDVLTVNGLETIMGKCPSLERLTISCEDPELFLIQCEHMNSEEICLREHIVRHESLKHLVLLDVRSRLPTLILPQLESFHWELCSECKMNAVVHDFGSNVINNLKRRGELPESFGRVRNGLEPLELEVKGFFLGANDIMDSLPRAPKLQRMFLEIGEPQNEKEIYLRYPKLKNLTWKRHLG
mmetsp:Transcript_30919/g.75408  ORF Transcript_30919/g.75408 Transcript_30919/m.75408 type:complete len:543 (-) Transcript_30919:282-1910(-)